MAVVQSTSARSSNLCGELSGPCWCSRFPGSESIDALAEPFRSYVVAFLSALKHAGASVTVSATFRPVERAYMIHWSWMIKKRRVKPKDVPPMDAVRINWVHPREVDSLSAATNMCIAFETARLGTQPALRSLHERRLAIDMSISWQGDLTVRDDARRDCKIESMPRSGMNQLLHVVGATYGVTKYNRDGVDRPHWSINGS